MLSDIEIAQAAKMQPITEIAAKLGLQGEDIIPYGHYKAKLNHKLAKADKPEGKLILVTAISPTPAGEGKTTTSVGLADAMNALGKKTMLCLPVSHFLADFSFDYSLLWRIVAFAVKAD